MNSIKMIISKIKDGSIHEMIDELKWMFSYGKNYKKEIILYTLLGIFSIIMTLISSIASKELINIVTGIQKNRAVEMGVLMVSMAVFSLLFGQFMNRITLKINIRVQNEIQADIFDQIIHVNWLDLSHYHSGDILNRFSNDVKTVADSAIGWIPNLIISLFNFFATLGLIFYYDPTMMVLALLNAPVLLVASKIITSKMREHNKKVKEMNSEMMAFQSETFENVDSIKSFNLASQFTLRLKDMQAKYKEVNLDYNLFTIKANLILSLVSMVLEFSFFGWAVYRLWTNAINYGEMTLFLTQSKRLSSAFATLISILPSTVSSTISAGRLIEIIRLPKEEKRKVDLEDMILNGFSIELKDVGFSYVKDHQVLLSSSMEANKGEIVALVGPSGEGKTTLLRLLLGLIVPNEGKAYIKGKDGREIELGASTRELFSYVPQGNTIFSGSIADNLRMVNPEASDKEIILALKSACAYDFVEKMDNGIYSIVGAHGKGLSEGQTQRIAIARAMLRKAPVLLLDEATSALDIQTEKQVLKNLMEVYPDKICIVTSHRPAILKICTRVYKILNTQLSELSNEELLALAEGKE